MRSRPHRRKENAPNKSAAIENTPAPSMPQTPLDFALRLMRDEDLPANLRAGMAKAALPYLHARRPAAEPPPPPPARPPMSPIEIARRIAFILHEGAKAEKEEQLRAGGKAS